jgi:ribosomal protein RSM22 (predicted rRNA methylase)
MTLPREIEEKIRELIGFDEPRKEPALRRNLFELADDFQRRNPNEDRYSDAYLAYNFPSNMMKVISVMNEIGSFQPRAFPDRDRYDVLDIGSGEGAGMFGFFFARDGIFKSGFSLRGIDASPKMLEKCRTIGDHLAARHTNLRISLNRRRLTPLLEREIEGNYDAILCVNALAEIIPANPLDPKLVIKLLRHLKPSGIIIIIEPALKTFTRRLMKLRDELTGRSSVRIVLPCLHVAACPLLRIASQDEWCHETRVWDPPAYLLRLNQGLNREIDRLKFSFLVVARGKPEEQPTQAYRVISRRIKEKGKTKCYLCAARGRMEMVRLDKDRSESNSAFDEIRQGDVIRIENAEMRERYMKIRKETTVSFFRK